MSDLPPGRTLDPYVGVWDAGGMTQPTPPLDLDAVENRYEAANRHTWPMLLGEEDNEFWDRVDADQKMAAAASLADIPTLIAEVRRLQELLHPANADLAPGWLAAVQALRVEADGWRRLGDDDRGNTLDVAAATLGRLDSRPRPSDWARKSGPV